MKTGTFYWETKEYHHDNTFTLNDWLENQMEELVEITLQDGGYCEVTNAFEENYSLMASGNGNSFNHQIKIKKL
jgi:hypothetical protein